MRFLELLSTVCLVPLALGDKASEAPTCPVGERCKDKSSSPYFWPHAHGHPDYYGNSPWPGPTDLKSSLQWRWNGPTGELYSESFNGVVIDDKKNLYVNGDKSVYKLSPDGQLQWTYRTRTSAAADGPALMDGVVFVDGTEGYVYAIDMDTGAEKWVVKASNHNGGQYGHISAHNGVLVTQGDLKIIPQGSAFAGEGACGTVRGLNATNGKELWRYEPEGVLWDWFPQFPDDESVIFGDHNGKLYRVGLKDGQLIWKNGGVPTTWTDGCQFVANNGLVYTVVVDHTKGCFPRLPDEIPQCAGTVTAFRVSDGTMVWEQDVDKPPNTAPVVGRLGKDDRLSLVMPIGQQTGICEPEAFAVFKALPFLQQLPQYVQFPLFGVFHRLSVFLGDDYNWMLWGKLKVTHDVLAFDAQTGTPLWKWQGPTSVFRMAPGDRDGFIPRTLAGIRSISCPTPWSAPRIGSDGTVYVGNQNGAFYAIRDADGNNRIDEKEVSVYETKGVFTHIGSAHAPGMVAALNFDSLFVFKS